MPVTRTLLTSTTMLASVLLAGAASAQPVSGLYIGAGVGYSILQDQSVSIDPATNASNNQNQNQNQNGVTAHTHAKFSGGVIGVGSIGYGFGNGLRVELQGDYRQNSQSKSNGGGNESQYGGMANVLFDIDPGLGWVFPYLGLGGGWQETRWDGMVLPANGITANNFNNATTSVRVGQSVGRLAYQGIVGASFPIGLAPGLSLTAEYRYMALSGDRSYAAVATTTSSQGNQSSSTTAGTRVHSSDDASHAFLVGLRYAFNAGDAVAPPAPPLVTPASAPVPTRTYLIFFDWDRAELTQRARDLVAEAVRNSARVQHTLIQVSGYADRSGSPAYNQRLSLQRAQNVAAEMQRYGVPASAIDVHAYGDTRPLVPTAAGVREPQNRRVEIVYQ